VIDAYQFCVDIYDEKEGLIHYTGMIEEGKQLPDFSVDASDRGRLASWCIQYIIQYHSVSWSIIRYHCDRKCQRQNQAIHKKWI
jgi:hypothetical protein